MTVKQKSLKVSGRADAHQFLQEIITKPWLKWLSSNIGWHKLARGLEPLSSIAPHLMGKMDTSQLELLRPISKPLEMNNANSAFPSRICSVYAVYEIVASSCLQSWNKCTNVYIYTMYHMWSCIYNSKLNHINHYCEYYVYLHKDVFFIFLGKL